MAVLEGKAAIVTGSARGIGRAAAELLAEHGARVLISDVDADLARTGRRGDRRRDGRVRRRPHRDGAAEALVKAAVDAFGQIDIVVNNAGYTWDGMAHKMSDEQFRAMLEIHTVVPFKVLRAAAPYLRDAGKADRDAGREVFRKVVNVTSISGTQGNLGQVELLDGEGRTRRADEDAGPRVGAVQGQRERGRLRLRRDAPDRPGRQRRDDRARRQRDPARDPQAMRELATDDHPARSRGDAAGRGRPDLLPLLAVVELRARPGDHRERRPDDGDDVMSSEARSTEPVTAVVDAKRGPHSIRDRSASPAPHGGTTSPRRRCAPTPPRPTTSPGGPVFAIVPVWETIAPASRSVASDEARKRVVHYEQDIVLHRPLEAGDDSSCRCATPVALLRAAERDVARHPRRDADGGRRARERAVRDRVLPRHRRRGERRRARAATIGSTRTATDPLAEVGYRVAEDQPDRYAAASGDDFAIHLDDDFARAVGLPGRIVHGLCTMAFAAPRGSRGGRGRRPARVRTRRGPLLGAALSRRRP